MPIDRQKPAAQVDPKNGDYPAMLEQLQANILKPHGRNFARHIFIRFSATPDVIAKWIRERVAPHVTTQWSEYNVRGADGGPVHGFFLSATGYGKLGLSVGSFESEAFRNGMKYKNDGIIEAVFDRRNDDPPSMTWEPGFRGEVDALVTIAADGGPAGPADGSIVEELSQKMQRTLVGVGDVLTVEKGNVLRRAANGKAPEEGDPVEHFGYRDGISQPIFTKPDLAKKAGVGPTPKWDPGAPLSILLAEDPFGGKPDAFGSYLAYRRLEQDLDLFEDSVHVASKAIGATRELVGAMIVGRFKDGSPVVETPTPTGNPANDFTFRDDDRDGNRCPFHAHIRKVNPRGTTPLTSSERERKRRIARRGIPYGPPVSTNVADFPPSDADKTNPRGLLFLCFQANIDEQFEFIQRTWVDNSIFPKGFLFATNTGDDALIGQDLDEAQRWPKKWDDPDAGKKTYNFESAVTLKGGEYFFAPSMPFLKTVGV